MYNFTEMTIVWHDIPIFMKIGTGVGAILSSCLRNVKGCDAGTIDGKELRGRR
jgi:hypothetical protein